jgi:hypothetical protein
VNTSKAVRDAHLAAVAHTLDALKIAAGCIDCGYNQHPRALHFDHRDPQTKRAALGWYDDRSKLLSKARLAKYLHHVETYCDVRCANCHAVRSANEAHEFVTRSTSISTTTPAAPHLF